MNTKLPKLLLPQLLAVLLACSDKPATKVNKIDHPLPTDSIQYSQMSISETSVDEKSDIVLSENTVLTFFNLYNYSTKKDSNTNSLDSNTIQAINHPDRLLLYQLIDQYGSYKMMLEPLIDSYKLKKIDVTNLNTRLVFNSNNKLFKLDINPFKSADGLILYRPGKKLIAWTTPSYNHSKVREQIKDYFGQ